MVESTPKDFRTADRVFAGTTWCAALAVSLVFLWILADLLLRGAKNFSLDFLWTAVEDSGRAGGIGPVLASTVIVLAVCLAAAVPIALGTATLLSEFARNGSKLAGMVRRSLDLLAGVPSIVFGLFGNAFFCVYLGMGFSVLSGGLTLACMALPLVTRVLEEGLRAVSDEYRSAGTALGMSRSALLLHVLLPTAAPAIAAAAVLGVGRALAETAALLFTSGYVTRWPGSLLDSGRVLSLHIYDLAMNVPGGEPNACASALVLLVLLGVINTVAGRLAHRWHRRQTAGGIV